MPLNRGGVLTAVSSCLLYLSWLSDDVSESLLLTCVTLKCSNILVHFKEEGLSRQMNFPKLSQKATAFQSLPCEPHSTTTCAGLLDTDRAGSLWASIGRPSKVFPKRTSSALTAAAKKATWLFGGFRILLKIICNHCLV